MLVPIGTAAREALQSLTVSYDGGTNAGNAATAVQLFNFRTRRWVRIFEHTGRRDRSFDWSRSARARRYVSAKGRVRVRVEGTRGAPFRTRTDLVEVSVEYVPTA